MLATNTMLKELDLSSNSWEDGRGHLQGDSRGFAQELAVGIRDNRALTSLNLSSNLLKAEGAKIVAKAIHVTNYVIAVNLVPVSCPSDRWLNCCCLLLSPG
jgi:hypothetical protein